MVDDNEKIFNEKGLCIWMSGWYMIMKKGSASGVHAQKVSALFVFIVKGL